MEDDIGVAIEQSERNKDQSRGDRDGRPTRCGSDFAGVVGGDATRHAESAIRMAWNAGSRSGWVEQAAWDFATSRVFEGLWPQFGSKTMVEALEVGEKDDRVAAFEERIAKLQRDGVGAYPPLGHRTPWADATEQHKLEEIVWESWTVSHGSSVAGRDALAVIERDVDHAGLPTEQRELLQDLRARVDAGEFVEPFRTRRIASRWPSAGSSVSGSSSK